MMRQTLLVLIAAVLGTGCHSAAVQPEPMPAGSYQVDGYYTFKINYSEGTRSALQLGGAFVIADSRVLWSGPNHCRPSADSTASDGLDVELIECNHWSARSLRLRIHRTDPVNKSRWYADVVSYERGPVCADPFGATCRLWVRGYVPRWRARSGIIEVERGIPSPPDGLSNPSIDRLKRLRCDTVSTQSCARG